MKENRPQKGLFFFIVSDCFYKNVNLCKYIQNICLEYIKLGIIIM